MIATETMTSLYRRNKVTKPGLKKAVQDGIITAEQYAAITGEDYEA